MSSCSHFSCADCFAQGYIYNIFQTNNNTCVSFANIIALFIQYTQFSYTSTKLSEVTTSLILALLAIPRSRELKRQKIKSLIDQTFHSL